MAGRNPIASKNIDTYKVVDFAPAVNSALNQKWKALNDLESELDILEASLEDEKKFIAFFSQGKDKDVVALNVCGTPISTTSQTLNACPEATLASSILGQQDDELDAKVHPIEEWNTEDVVAWLNTVDGLAPSIVDSFEEDEVTGPELLALGREDLMFFGITKKGTIAYILSEVKKLERTHNDKTVHVEHSPYCMDKIIDYLRLENMFIKGVIEVKPKAPVVRASERSRFERVVKLYFPGNSSRALLGILFVVILHCCSNVRDWSKYFRYIF